MFIKYIFIKIIKTRFNLKYYMSSWDMVYTNIPIEEKIETNVRVMKVKKQIILFLAIHFPNTPQWWSIPIIQTLHI